MNEEHIVRLSNGRLFIGDVEIGEGDCEVTMSLNNLPDMVTVQHGRPREFTVETQMIVCDPLVYDELRRGHKARLN